jgi:4-amino-4-deoxy-L-arabinose transferase-like glycosyltransferase
MLSGMSAGSNDASPYSLHRWWHALLPVALIALFIANVLLSHSQMSQTFDEGFHLVAGYRYLQCGDFGINTEHPPLVKMVAALPLRLSHVPPPSGSVCGKEPTTKNHGYELGVDYLYKQGLDAQKVLSLGRMGTIVFAGLFLILVFLYARYLFGFWAAIIALVLAVSEPTLTAHAALVTTDMAVSAGVLAAVFLLDRYLRTRTKGALALAGIGVGLSLSTKHSGVIVVPIVMAVTIADEWLRGNKTGGRARHVLNTTAALICILVIGVGVLWATYGFHYWPRPQATPMTTSLADFLTRVRTEGTRGVMPDYLIPFAAQWHLLPLAYLYGLVDVLNVSHPGLPPWILGRLLPHGVWYYFPITFLIKSTPAFLVLLVMSLAAGKWLRPERRRAFAFLILPVMMWYGAAMTSGLDIGYRHVLPALAFLILLISGGLAYAAQTRTRKPWRYLIGLLLAAQIASAVFVYPDYFAYSDEFLGGERNTYKYLTDSNNDWGQALYQTALWLKARNITDCWIAYDGAADLKYYGVPCRILPGNPGDIQAMPPPTARGLFIISGLSYAGVEWEPRELQPYEVFHNVPPSDNIGGAMLVYNGTFDLRRVQAVNYIIKADTELAQHPAAALEDAQSALALTPTSVRARLVEAHALDGLQKRDQAKRSFAAALSQAEQTGAGWYPAQIAEARKGLAQ